MNKATVNTWCGIGIVLPLILRFWPMPYNMWLPLVSALLCTIPAMSAQILFCGFRKAAWLQVVPLVLTGLLAGWATVLYFTSAMDLFADYVSPFIGCMIVWEIWHVRQKARS